jgi:hypothetical protein
MRKIMKYLGITLSVISILLLFILLTRHVDRTGHFDTVMVDNELYFILAEECEVRAVTVFKSSTTTPNPALVVWSTWVSGGDNHSEVRQIKYGQIKGFNSQEGPKELKKNVGYFALMGTSVKASLGTVGDFIIVDSNKVIMRHHFDSKRPKNRTVIIEKNGQKITVPYSVSFDEDGNKVIVSGSELTRSP